MTPEDLQQAREFAKLFLPDQQGAKPPILVQAVIASVTNGVVSLYLSGEQAISIGGIRYLDNYQPTTSDVVWCLKNGPDILVLGKLRPSASQYQQITKLMFSEEVVTPKVESSGILQLTDGAGTVIQLNNAGVASVTADEWYVNSHPYASSRHAAGLIAGGSRSTFDAAGPGPTALLAIGSPSGGYRSGRSYEFVVDMPATRGNGGTGVWQVEVVNSSTATQYALWRHHLYSSSDHINFHGSRRRELTGSISLQIRVTRISGSGNFYGDILGNTTVGPACQLSIYDVGPA